MQLNVEDGGNRKYIMVQLPEVTDESSEAYIAGYKNICEIGKECIRRAGKKLTEKDDQIQLVEGQNPLDVGFQVFKLDNSNLREWDSTPVPDNDLNLFYERLNDMVDSIKPGWILSRKLLQFLSKSIYECDPEPEYNFGEIHIASSIGNLPSDLLQYLKSTYNYFYGYSKFSETSYFGNHCQHCGVLQGDFYLFEEVDSPFFIDSEESARALKIFKINLPFDIKTPCSIGLGSEDYLIKKHAKIYDFGGKLNET